MRVALIDYGSGNLRSAAKAFERAAQEAGLAATITVTAKAEEARRADRLVLPGVGAFADCHAGLCALPGMVEALREAALERGRPFLGICVGMQLLASRGLEHGTHQGLDWIPGTVAILEPKAPEATAPPSEVPSQPQAEPTAGPGFKIPHMGWNALEVLATDHPVLAGLDNGTHVYFVHSYQMHPDTPADRLAVTDYGGPVTAVVGRDTLVGTQFHPEKSQAAGLRLITNFLRWAP